jgi:hypothetical protein
MGHIPQLCLPGVENSYLLEPIILSHGSCALWSAMNYDQVDTKPRLTLLPELRIWTFWSPSSKHMVHLVGNLQGDNWSKSMRAGARECTVLYCKLCCYLWAGASSRLSLYSQTTLLKYAWSYSIAVLDIIDKLLDEIIIKQKKSEKPNRGSLTSDSTRKV